MGDLTIDSINTLDLSSPPSPSSMTPRKDEDSGHTNNNWASVHYTNRVDGGHDGPDNTNPGKIAKRVVIIGAHQEGPDAENSESASVTAKPASSLSSLQTQAPLASTNEATTAVTHSRSVSSNNASTTLGSEEL
jgi:hypothetical protein